MDKLEMNSLAAGLEALELAGDAEMEAEAQTQDHAQEVQETFHYVFDLANGW